MNQHNQWKHNFIIQMHYAYFNSRTNQAFIYGQYTQSSEIFFIRMNETKMLKAREKKKELNNEKSITTGYLPF